MLQKYNNMCLIIRVYSITLMCVAVCFDTHTEVTWNVEFLHTAGPLINMSCLLYFRQNLLYSSCY